MLWRINLRNLVRNKANICKEYHIQPSEIDRLSYFEYEEYLIFFNEEHKKEEEQRKKDEKNNRIPNMNSMMKNYSLPKVSMPKMR